LPNGGRTFLYVCKPLKTYHLQAYARPTELAVSGMNHSMVYDCARID
jgi:hypothetical protein